MRTKFVHVLLEEQWNKLGYKYLEALRRVRQCRKIPEETNRLSIRQYRSCFPRQFRRELVVYFLYLISWAAWCMAGRSSCPPPPTLGEDLGHLAGAMASASGAGRCCGRPKLLMFYIPGALVISGFSAVDYLAWRLIAVQLEALCFSCFVPLGFHGALCARAGIQTENAQQFTPNEVVDSFKSTHFILFSK